MGIALKYTYRGIIRGLSVEYPWNIRGLSVGLQTEPLLEPENRTDPSRIASETNQKPPKSPKNMRMHPK